ncbi:MAG: hypothetical protein AAFQ41_15945 [Cyanobacteria bacterium J06623_7]
MEQVSLQISEWLESKFTKGENGIIIDSCEHESFDIIQDFLAEKEHSYKTYAIYYDAFAEESPTEFMNTLAEELGSKLGHHRAKSCPTLTDKIVASELKMVIIDRSYLHSIETTNALMTWLNQYGVSLVLVGSKTEMNQTQYLNHPSLTGLSRFIVGNCCCGKVPVYCQ